MPQIQPSTDVVYFTNFHIIIIIIIINSGVSTGSYCSQERQRQCSCRCRGRLLSPLQSPAFQRTHCSVIKHHRQCQRHQLRIIYIYYRYFASSFIATSLSQVTTLLLAESRCRMPLSASVISRHASTSSEPNNDAICHLCILVAHWPCPVENQFHTDKIFRVAIISNVQNVHFQHRHRPTDNASTRRLHGHNRLVQQTMIHLLCH